MLSPFLSDYFCLVVHLDQTKTILIPTDFSDNSWNAMAYALKLFTDTPCVFYVLHVGSLRQSSTKSNAFTFPDRKINEDLRERLADLFRRIRSLPRNKGHHFIALMEYGKLIDIVRRLVHEKRITLIVMGTKGATGIKGAIMGSNTGDVITKIKCDVLVVPEKAQYRTIERVAFATDYTIFYTNPILEAIAELLNSTQASLSVLQIRKSNKKLSPTQEGHKDFLFEYLNEVHPNKVYDQSVPNDHLIRAIEEFSTQKKIDILAMVAKNLNFLQQLFFDSTIEKLSFQTTIPLLVLHE